MGYILATINAAAARVKYGTLLIVGLNKNSIHQSIEGEKNCQSH